MQSRTTFQFEERCSSIIDLIVTECKIRFEVYESTPKRKAGSPIKDITNKRIKM